MTQYCLPLLLISSFAAVLARLNMIGCLVVYIHYCGPDYTFSPHHPLFISSVENIHKPADIIISIKAGGKQYTNQTQFNHSHLSVTITSLMLK